MERIAAWLGILLGVALRHAAPAIVPLIRDAIHDGFLAAFTHSMEDAQRDPELRDRLVKKINEVKNK